MASSGNRCLVDYRNVDYRAFIFVVHDKHGLLLLHSTHKKDKGPHFQLPGGHVDEPEFKAAAQTSADADTQLLEAARVGAARELFEETAMDVRNTLYRLHAVVLRKKVADHKKYGKLLNNQLKGKLYFTMNVSDDDFWKGDTDVATKGPDGTNLLLKLSHEHSSFTFASDPVAAGEELQMHSGGSGSKALAMSLQHKPILKVSRDPSKPGILPMKTEVPVWAQPSTTKGTTHEARSRDIPEIPAPPEEKGAFSCCFC